MNLREAARNRPCLVRIPGACNGNRETTVLAHIGPVGTRGMGIKQCDLSGAHACSSCHDVIDGRAPHPGGMSREYVRACAVDGVLRTIDYLYRSGTFSTNRAGEILWHPYPGAL